MLRIKGILCQAMHEDKTCGATLLPVAAVAIPLLHGSADKEEQTRGRALSLLHSMEVSKDKCVECALTSVVRMIVQQDLCMCPVVASVPSGCHERKDGKVQVKLCGFCPRPRSVARRAQGHRKESLHTAGGHCSAIQYRAVVHGGCGNWKHENPICSSHGWKRCALGHRSKCHAPRIPIYNVTSVGLPI